jgi:16S rRNA (guanine1207-N2)-methyltransferase
MSLANATELLLRHGVPSDARTLVVGVPDADSVQRLPRAGATFLLHDYAVFRSVRSAAECRFGPWLPSATPPFERAIVYLPKGRARLAMTLALTAGTLVEGGELWLVGGNNEGIRSAVKPLEAAAGPATKRDSARHCSLFVARRTRPAAAPAIEPWVESWPLEVAGETLAIRSLPGVFSHGRLDEGTARLLDVLAPPAHGRVLDVGCGAGVLGCHIARRHPGLRVELVDSDALAVESARRTLAANGVSNGEALASDVFSDVEGPFDYIVSNPPFHQHVRTDYRVHRALIEGAAHQLRPGGVLQLVANRFLDLGGLLTSAFGRFTVDLEDNRFRVYRAVR